MQLQKVGLLAVLLLMGCAPKIDPNQPIEPGPFPDQYEKAVKTYLQNHLKDPYSIRDLEISEPYKRRLWTGLLHDGYIDVWVSCVSYNAKNSFGAYVGRKRYLMAIRPNTIVVTSTGRAVVREGC